MSTNPAATSERRQPCAAAINDVLMLDGMVVRVLAGLPKLGQVVLFPLPPAGKPVPHAQWRQLPFVRPLKGLMEDAERHPDPAFAPPLAPRAADLKVRDARWERIKDIVDRPEIFFTETRGPLLKTHAARFDVTPKTLLHDLRLWWIGGQFIDALLGRYYRSGRITEDTKNVQRFVERGERSTVVVLMASASGRKSAPGRRPKSRLYEPYLMTDKEREQALETGRKYWLADRSRTLHMAALEVLRLEYSPKVRGGLFQTPPDAEPDRPLKLKANLPRGKVPSVRQLTYLLRRVIPPARVYIARHGAADFSNNAAPLLGTVTDDAVSPADVYEGDDTPLDFWIVARRDRRALLGKPYLHLLVSRTTGLIVGFFLTLDSPSYEDFKLCILSTCNDWQAVCEKYGVTYVPEAWPAECVVANRIFGDRAGLLTFASDGISRIDLDLTNAPPGFSRSKATVEGAFARLRRYLEGTEGYEPPWNIQKRRRQKYEKFACLTLDELYAVLLEAITALNMQAVVNRQQPLSRTQAGELPTPSALWLHDIGVVHALPRRVSREWMRRQLLEVGVATVTGYGVRFRDNYYSSDELRNLEWFSTASLRAEFEVTVRYMGKNLDEIEVEDPFNPDRRFRASLTSRSHHAEHMSEAQREQLSEAERAMRRNAKHHNDEVVVGTRQRIAERVRGPKQDMLEVTQDMSLARRKQLGQEAREQEADERRREDFRLDDANRETTATEDVPVHSSDDDRSRAAEPPPSEDVLDDANAIASYLHNRKLP